MEGSMVKIANTGMKIKLANMPADPRSTDAVTQLAAAPVATYVLCRIFWGATEDLSMFDLSKTCRVHRQNWGLNTGAILSGR